MQVINTRNVHQALPKVMYLIKTQGVARDSRNGPVLKVPGPVTICYEKPKERVMFWPERNANPFFHCLEALWMLAGRNDVAFPAGIVRNMANFSDDGDTFNGAYGYRWRQHYGFDQLTRIAQALAKDRYDRRQVLSMWDGDQDLGSNSKDVPCNTQAYFSRTDTGALDMTVTNRSNDAVWGALGANAVHFSMLQEYLAVMIGCEVGKYWQVTNNLHLYLDHHRELMEKMVHPISFNYENSCPYERGIAKPTPLILDGDVATFDSNVATLLDTDMPLGMTDWFCRNIANPLLQAIRAYKAKQADRVNVAQSILAKNMPVDSDWLKAGWEWLERRAK